MTAWRDWQPHSVFLWLASVFGLAVLAANPPFQAPDENDHFYRAYQLSEGGWVGTKHDGNSGGHLPAEVFFATDMGDIPFHSDKKVTAELLLQKWARPFVDLGKDPRRFVAFPHTVFYPPCGYLFQAVAIALGRAAHVGPVGLMYFARLAVLAGSIVLGYWALRELPVFRWSSLLLLLAPMSLYLMGSLAPDGILIAGSFLLAALLLKRLVSENPPNGWKTCVGLLALGSLLATSKVVYLPLVLLLPLWLLPQLSSRRAKVIFCVGFAATCVLPLWIWGRLAAPLYVPGRTDILIDPVAQSRHVLAHPFQFIALVVESIWVGFDGIYRWFVGTLGWGDTPLPDWFYRVYGWGLIACVVAESADGSMIRKWQRVALLVASVVAVVLIFGAQYVSWNAPGSRTLIEGIGGRYFLPLAPFTVAAFPSLGKIRFPEIVARTLGILLAVACVVVCLKAVIWRYYLP